MATLLPIVQIVISVLLIGVILLQRRSGGLSPAFGGGGAYRTRRGVERGLFGATIALAVLFIAAALLNIVLR